MLPSRRDGFTLVELSIVLVILGLLVGGVLAGQSLIRAAELRSVVSQYNNLMVAKNAFREKYFTIPGDMTNATAFWGAAAVGAGCKTTAGTGTQTCDGDGNGIVDLYSTANSDEVFRFWQHLANAGLIEGNFDGIAHGSTDQSATTANSPLSKTNNGLWYIDSWGTLSGSPGAFDGTYNNFLTLGGAQANSYPGGSIFPTAELWNLDLKIDDGKPATGKMKVLGAPVFCTDTASSSNMAAEYLVSNTSLGCNPLFPGAF